MPEVTTTTQPEPEIPQTKPIAGSETPQVSSFQGDSAATPDRASLIQQGLDAISAGASTNSGASGAADATTPPTAAETNDTAVMAGKREGAYDRGGTGAQMPGFDPDLVEQPDPSSLPDKPATAPKPDASQRPPWFGVEGQAFDDLSESEKEDSVIRAFDGGFDGLNESSYKGAATGTDHAKEGEDFTDYYTDSGRSPRQEGEPDNYLAGMSEEELDEREEKIRAKRESERS